MAERSPSARHIVRFAVFDLDLRSGELSKNGHRPTLPEQPLALLTALVERPGQLVTRDELRQRLWPADTFVDFEHGLNAAVKRLRDALGDSADTPRFIETVPRRGYRFIAPVDADGSGTALDPGVSGHQALPDRRRTDLESRHVGLRAALRGRGIALAVPVALLLGIGAWWALHRAPMANIAPRQTVARKLTRLTYGPGLQTDAAWSPDSRFIAYASDKAGNFDIWVQSVSGGNAVHVTKSPAQDTQPDWSPDGSTIVFRSERDGGGLFIVPSLGGVERRVTSFGVRPKWAPDGSGVLFAAAPSLDVGRSLQGALYNVWALPFDDVGGRALGVPFRVTHFDSLAHQISTDIGSTEQSVSRTRLVLPMTDMTGSIWMLDNVDR